ncbi:uncharacterized protein DS421_15g521270 [Arachis hypogaea]|nr:uncharacterized protein DS421_15g521270 [Arachis hypogaea]
MGVIPKIGSCPIYLTKKKKKKTSIVGLAWFILSALLHCLKVEKIKITQLSKTKSMRSQLNIYTMCIIG